MVYLYVSHTIRDGEIEYGDNSVVEITNVTKEEMNDQVKEAEVEVFVTKVLAEANLGEENEDWEFHDGYAEGIHGEYRIFEVNEVKVISKEDFEVLKKYLHKEEVAI